MTPLRDWIVTPPVASRGRINPSGPVAGQLFS
jgi:hypothetical protein